MRAQWALDRLGRVASDFFRATPAQAYKFGEFYSPIMNDGDFDAKPMVLLRQTVENSFFVYL